MSVFLQVAVWISRSLPRSFHILWLWLARKCTYMHTHTQTSAEPHTNLTKYCMHTHTLTHRTALLFRAPPLYIPLELSRTSLLLLNFESASEEHHHSPTERHQHDGHRIKCMEYIFTTSLFWTHSSDNDDSYHLLNYLHFFGFEPRRCWSAEMLTDELFWISSASLTQWAIKMKTMDVTCSFSL